MKQRTWREKAQQVIAGVLTRVDQTDKEALEQALFDAYPFGIRGYYPYKVWRQERNRLLVELGHKKARKKRPKRPKRPKYVAPGQPGLFGE